MPYWLTRTRFNPHAREGRDLVPFHVHAGLPVSIHTPAKSVTSKDGGDVRIWWGFNPHAREGRDLMLDTM